MSKNTYYGQRCVELLSLTNQDILNAWKVLSGVKKVFDEKLKSFVLCSKAKTPVPLMYWPKQKTNMVLNHPILVLQVYLAVESSLIIDIKIICQDNLRKRITLSTTQKSPRIASLSVILPLSTKSAGTWSHLLVDLEDIVSSVWKRDLYRSIDSIHLSGSFSLKRMFTLRRDMVYNEEGVWFIKYHQLPKQMLLSRNDSHNYNTVHSVNVPEIEEGNFSTPSTSRNQLIYSPVSSNSSGHFTITSRDYDKESISRPTSSRSMANKSRSSFCQGNTTMKSRITEQDPKIMVDQVLPLLSRFYFKDYLKESTPGFNED